MGWGRKRNADIAESTPTGAEDEQFSTAQESTPVPWLAGERKVALRWITRVYNQRAEAAPVARPGKK